MPHINSPLKKPEVAKYSGNDRSTPQVLGETLIAAGVAEQRDEQLERAIAIVSQ